MTPWINRFAAYLHDPSLPLMLMKSFNRNSHTLAVPAGAVYYFEANSADEACKLAAAINWHGNPKAADFPKTIKNRRRTRLGEKGFGLGVCGTWSFFP